MLAVFVLLVWLAANNQLTGRAPGEPRCPLSFAIHDGLVPFKDATQTMWYRGACADTVRAVFSSSPSDRRTRT